jgi:hypothetical protein
VRRAVTLRESASLRTKLCQITQLVQNLRESAGIFLARNVQEGKMQKRGTARRTIMARVIEFHVPDKFQAKKQWSAPQGKLLEFPARGVKTSAAPIEGMANLASSVGDIPVLRQMPVL